MKTEEAATSSLKRELGAVNTSLASKHFHGWAFRDPGWHCYTIQIMRASVNWWLRALPLSSLMCKDTSGTRVNQTESVLAFTKKPSQPKESAKSKSKDESKKKAKKEEPAKPKPETGAEEGAPKPKPKNPLDLLPPNWYWMAGRGCTQTPRPTSVRLLLTSALVIFLW